MNDSTSEDNSIYPKFTSMHLLILISLTLVAVPFAQGEGRTDSVITFDDLPEPIYGFGPISNVYAGLQWQNFSYLDGSHFFVGPSGYSNGVVSVDNVAYGWGGVAYSSVLHGATFDLVSAYFTAAWNDDLILDVQGFVGNVLLYETSYSLDPTSPAFISFNYDGVDRVVFTSHGGTPHAGYSLDGGAMFVLDDLKVTIVPEPSTSLMCATGVFLGFWIRRKTF